MRTDRWTCIAKLIVAFRNFQKAPNSARRSVSALGFIQNVLCYKSYQKDVCLFIYFCTLYFHCSSPYTYTFLLSFLSLFKLEMFFAFPNDANSKTGSPQSKAVNVTKDVRLYTLPPWSSFLFETALFLQTVKEFPAFYKTRRFIVVFTMALHLSLPLQSSIPLQDPL